MSRHTGLDAVVAKMVPAGATITAATWHVALHYGPGDPHPTERDGLAYLIDQAEKRERGERDAEGLLPEGSLTLDLRWTMRYADGGGVETTVSRTTYDSLDEAREHLARIDKFTPMIEALDRMA